MRVSVCTVAWFAALAAFASPVAGQGPTATTADGRNLAVKTLLAVRLGREGIRLDGRLDDSAWTRAQPAEGFVMREPREGEPAPERTEVRFLFDDDALYIGARMYSASPGDVRALVARRDRETDSEQVIVSLDTYLDRRTAYTFAVTAAGVRLDYYHAADFESSKDYTFDPVWEAKTSVDAQGWTAEMRIPFTQLRFSPADQQTWGVNLVRRVPARNELAYWMLIGRSETGWASRMGRLTGLQGVRPSRRIELMPYVASNATLADSVDPADPFAEQRSANARVGADLKVGLGSGLTLDATINPDFGQVEADPAIVNLTAYETFFSERRPFFLEGSGLMGGRSVYYSRRIGAPPPGRPGAQFAQQIDNTTILGAAKLTGRLPSGLSVGALSAVTAREKVATYDAPTSTFGEAVVAPLAVYGVGTVQQEFGRDRSTIAATVTAVDRDVEPGSPLASVVARRALAGLVDSRVRWGGGRYDASAYVTYTHVEGDSLAILGLQRSSRRYYQRPDADHVDVDPSRTSLNGVALGINHSKLAGRWRWDVDYYEERPGFEPNDVGALGSADDRGLLGDIFYRETRPGRVFHNYRLGIFGLTEWNFDGVRQFSLAEFFGGVTFKNFWNVEWSLGLTPRALSDNLTRGGPLMGTGRSTYLNLDLENSSRSRTRWSAELSLEQDELDGWERTLEGQISVRPGGQLEISLDPQWFRGVTARQYVTSRSGGSPATFDRRYVFAYVDRSELSAQLRVNFAVTPDLTLETYLEPFASSGRYYDLGELAAARSRELRTYGTDGTTVTTAADGSRTVADGADQFVIPNLDFDVRSLRSNVVVRWEWRAGSTLYLVWQQNRFREEPRSRTVGVSEVFDAFKTSGDNFLALKVSYWLAVR